MWLEITTIVGWIWVIVRNRWFYLRGVFFQGKREEENHFIVIRLLSIYKMRLESNTCLNYIKVANRVTTPKMAQISNSAWFPLLC